MSSSSSAQETPPTSSVDLSQSGVTIPSDSENYEANNELSSPPSSSSGSPLILYSPPTLWGLIRGAAINLVLPFINGLMLGFGELFAHEIAFRFGWSGTKVCGNRLKSTGGLLLTRLLGVSKI
jgi:Outer membrane protein TOM13